MAYQITGVSIVCSTVGSGADQRKHRSSASLALCGEFTGDRWIPRTKGQWRGKYFHLMTSSWFGFFCHARFRYIQRHNADKYYPPTSVTGPALQWLTLLTDYTAIMCQNRTRFGTIPLLIRSMLSWFQGTANHWHIEAWIKWSLFYTQIFPYIFPWMKIFE